MVILLISSIAFLAFIVSFCTTGSKAPKTQRAQPSPLKVSPSPAQLQQTESPAPPTLPSTSKEQKSREEKSGVKKSKKEKQKSSKGMFKFEGNVEDDPESIHTNLDSVKGEKNPLLSKRVQERLRGKSGDKKEKEKGDKQQPSGSKNSSEPDANTDTDQGPMMTSDKGPRARSVTFRNPQSKVAAREHNMDEIVALKAKKAEDKLLEEKKKNVCTPMPKSKESQRSQHSGYMGL